MQTHGQRWLVILLGTLLLILPVLAQDTRESLGPKDSKAGTKEPHPLTELMGKLNSSLRPQLRGRHPRVYVTEEGLNELRQRSRTTHRELWQRALEQVRALRKEAPPAPAQERRAQNEVGIGIAEAALAYKIEGDKKYLDAAKRYMDAAVSYDIWGYTYNKPNVDLAAGHLLYGMGWGYDLALSRPDRNRTQRYREKLSNRRGCLLTYYKPKPGTNILLQSESHVYSDGGSRRRGVRALRRSRPKRRSGHSWRERFTIACWRPTPKTVITTKVWNTGFSRRHGWSIISTRTRTRPAKTYTIGLAFG